MTLREALNKYSSN